MLSILGFLIVLAPLVIVHEFGHYIFARIFGVKAEIFSIGFGPRIWSKQLGETELRIAAIPLGGFVKLLGEDGETELPPELKNRALQRKPIWQRLLIFAGGPIFNILYAILVFMAILVIGEPQMSSVVGRVVKGSDAEQVGFMSGDMIQAVDGKPVKRFEEVIDVINDKPGQVIQFDVERIQAGAPKHLVVKASPSKHDGYSVYGESTDVGELQGLLPVARANIIGVSDPKSPVGMQGLKTGDKVLSFQGAPVETWEDLEQRYAAVSGEVAFGIESDGKARELKFIKPITSSGLGEDLGLRSSELFVERAMPGTPAEANGIKRGDRLVGVGEHDVQSFMDLRDAVQRAGEGAGVVQLRWERDGQIVKADIKPTATTTKDAALKKSVQFTVGVVPQLVWAEPKTFIERTWNPFLLIYRATERTVVFSYRNFVSLGKMFTGEVSVGTLGGPILIGKIAGESISRGLIAFLTTMAILSVGLGVLNILPVPMLDGGHIMLLLVEAVRRKPLSIRQMEVFQQVGFAMIMLLMVVVMRNDLSRLPFFN